MAVPKRPAEMATLDPWAEQMLLQERRMTLETEARIEADSVAAERRHDRRTQVLNGVGYSFGGILALALVLGIVYAIWSAADRGRQNDLHKTEERTLQVRYCTELEEPLERQFCLMALGLEPQESDNG